MAKLEDYFKNEETAGKIMKLIMPKSGLKSMLLQPSGEAFILYVNNIPVIYFDGNAITEMYLLGAKELHHDWLPFDVVKDIRFLELPNVESIGDEVYLGGLQMVSAPKLIRVGDWCDISKESQEFDAPSLKFVGKGFLRGAKNLKKLNVPNLEKAGSYFLEYNEELETLDLPKLEGSLCMCCRQNQKLSRVFAPKLQDIYDSFHVVTKLTILDLPNVTEIIDSFTSKCEIQDVRLPKLTTIDRRVLSPSIIEAYQRNEIAADSTNFLRGIETVQNASTIKTQEPQFIKDYRDR